MMHAIVWSPAPLPPSRGVTDRRAARVHCRGLRTCCRATLPDARLHNPPPALRDPDPGRGEPAHLRPVLRGQYAGRHGAHAARRQARDARSDPEVEGRARLRQAAGVELGRRGRRKADRHDLLQQVGAHVRRRLRPRRRRPRHRARDRHAHGAEPGHRGADLRPGPLRRDFLRPAAGLLPRHGAGFRRRRALRGDDVDLRPVLHHRRPVAGVQGLAPGADFRLQRRAGCGEVPRSCR
jgi:hypothetical protein